MPSGLANFVKGQGPAGNGQPANGEGLSRRAVEGMTAKVKPKDSGFKTPVIPQALRDHRNAPPSALYVQSLRGHEQNGGDPFAGSVLSDSDDTMRDLSPSNIRGYQAGFSSPGGQYFEGRNVVRQDVEPAYPGHYEDRGEEERGLEYDNDVDALGEEPDDRDEQIDSFQLRAGLVGVDIAQGQIAQVLQLRESQTFVEAQRLHNLKLGSNQAPIISSSISGRFIAANHVPGEVRRDSSARGGRVESRRRPNSPRNDQPILDQGRGYAGDEDIRQANPLQHGGRRDGRVELRTRTRVTTEHDPRGGEQDDEDRFRASDVEPEDSDGSGQASPSQRTPRAADQPNGQTPTSSQAGKRKEAEAELDYDSDTLSTMKYAALRDQAFDHDPRAPATHILPEIPSGPQTSLEDRLELLKRSDPHGQARFFAQMPLDQWEQAGDWFLARFGEILSDFKKARRAKREVSRAFEEELATLEEGVRAETEGIGEVFRQMKAGGESVLNRKAP